MTFADFIAQLARHLRPAELLPLGFLWGATLLGAGIAFLTQPYHGEVRTARGFLRFLLPKRVLTARQTRLDLAYALTTKFLRVLWRPTLVSNVAVAWFVYRCLSLGTSGGPPPLHEPGAAEAALLVVMGIVFGDFFNFLGHYLSHRFGILWEFHKVHHSALSLTPITEHRFHPVDEIWSLGWISLGIGTWIALAARFLAVPLADVTILGIDGYYLANAFSFFHLRHSHIYMRYPPWLERIVLSPAQHQIHHSRELRHWDRNLGLLFSFWDRMFGTFVHSEPEPATNLGLDAGQDGYLTVRALLVMPFLAIARRIFTRPQPEAARLFEPMGGVAPAAEPERTLSTSGA